MQTSLWIFALLGIVLANRESLYKRQILQGNDWSKFINLSTSFKSKSLIECGSVCSAQFNEGCDLYALKRTEKVCYVGYFDNQLTNFLTGQEGDQAVYVNLGKMLKAFQSTFGTIENVDSKKVWEPHIYKTKDMNPEHDYLDCSFVCKEVEKQNGCDFFLMEDEVCYLGKSGHSGGNLDVEFVNKTVYLMPTSIEAMTSSFGDKTDVVPKHWKAHTLEQRNDIEDETDCRGLAHLEEWHYSSFDTENQICSLGVFQINPEGNTEGNSQKIQINLNIITDFQNSVFSTRSTREHYFKHFLYTYFPNTKNVQHCNVHCAFDPNDQCDFSFMQSTNCYLGNFNTQSPIGHPGGTYQMNIFKGNVHDMTESLFPTTFSAQVDRWTKKIHETLDVVSENECAAHASLRNDPAIDFYVYIEPKCHLGDLATNNGGEAGTDLNEIRINQRYANEQLAALYNFQFDLPGSSWNQYVYEHVILSGSQSIADCQVMCELAGAYCDFFIFGSPNCYLARYSKEGAIGINVATTLKSYHQSSKVDSFASPLYWSWTQDTRRWDRHIYKNVGNQHIRACSMICLDDDQCEFYVFHQNVCRYGRTSYVRSEFTDDRMDVFFKRNYNENEQGFINTEFTNKDGTFVDASYWRYYIYHKNTESEGNLETRCANRCLMSHDDTCHFYAIYGGHCNLGRFNSAANGGGGTPSNSNIMKVKKTVSIDTYANAWMGGSNDGDCNYGYKKLNPGQSVTIRSDGRPYENNRYCRWQFYAPGSTRIEVRIGAFETFDANDRLWFRVGIAGGRDIGGSHHGTRDSINYNINSELLYMTWDTNGADTKNGWEGTVKAV